MRTLDAIASGSPSNKSAPPPGHSTCDGKPSLDDISTGLTDSHAPYAVFSHSGSTIGRILGKQLTTWCWLDSFVLALGAGGPVLSHLEHHHLSSCPITSPIQPSSRRADEAPLPIPRRKPWAMAVVVPPVEKGHVHTSKYVWPGSLAPWAGSPRSPYPILYIHDCPPVPCYAHSTLLQHHPACASCSPWQL